MHQDIVDVDRDLLRLRDDFKAIVRLGGEGEGTGGGVIVAPVVGAQAHLIHPRPQGQPLAALKAFRPNGEAELGRVADAGGAEGELVGISRVLVQGDAAEVDGVLGGIVDRDGVGRRIHLILLGIRRAEKPLSRFSGGAAPTRRDETPSMPAAISPALATATHLRNIVFDDMDLFLLTSE